MAGNDTSYLDVSVETPLSRQKIPNDEYSCTSSMANYFVRNKGQRRGLF